MKKFLPLLLAIVAITLTGCEESKPEEGNGISYGYGYYFVNKATLLSTPTGANTIILESGSRADYENPGSTKAFFTCLTARFISKPEGKLEGEYPLEVGDEMRGNIEYGEKYLNRHTLEIEDSHFKHDLIRGNVIITHISENNYKFVINSLTTQRVELRAIYKGEVLIEHQ